MRSDVVAGEDAEAAGVDGQGLMQPEFGGRIADGTGEDAGVGCAPGALAGEVLALAAVTVVDAACQTSSVARRSNSSATFR